MSQPGNRLFSALCFAAIACAGSGGGDPGGYRFTHSGEHWHVDSRDRDIDDLLERYPTFFAVILDPDNTSEPDLRPLRSDLERFPVDAHSYDGLNAAAIGYFELNYRSGLQGPTYFADSFRAAKLLALPWRAYGLVDDPELRDAILDFFEDAGSGEKLGTAATAPRLARIVSSLEAKESDPARRRRIAELAERLTVPPPEEHEPAEE